MEWRAIVGYEGLYEVSSTGRVRSLPRVVKHWTGVEMLRRGREMKLTPFKAYFRVTLSRDGAYKSCAVHTIVAAAFKGPRPQSLMTRHLDGNGQNNRAGNIVYGTAQENSTDRVNHGNAPRGEGHASAKLTEAKVRRIRKLLESRTGAAVAAMFGMSEQQISNLKLRKSWAHVA